MTLHNPTSYNFPYRCTFDLPQGCRPQSKHADGRLSMTMLNSKGSATVVDNSLALANAPSELQGLKFETSNPCVVSRSYTTCQSVQLVFTAIAQISPLWGILSVDVRHSTNTALPLSPASPSSELSWSRSSRSLQKSPRVRSGISAIRFAA